MKLQVGMREQHLHWTSMLLGILRGMSIILMNYATDSLLGLAGLCLYKASLHITTLVGKIHYRKKATFKQVILMTILHPYNGLATLSKRHGSCWTVM